MSKSRKEIEHGQRRHYILECAEKLFAEKGFDGVTVADIAKASEFSVGSLYLFFESKETLIQSLLLERVKQILEILEGEVKKDAPALEKLERAVGGILDMFTEHLDYFKVYVMEVKGPEWCRSDDVFGQEFHKLIIRSFENMASIFKQGINEGVFKEGIEPLYMAFFFDACLHSLMFYMITHGDELPMDEVRRGMQEMFYNGILQKPKGKK